MLGNIVTSFTLAPIPATSKEVTPMTRSTKVASSPEPCLSYLRGCTFSRSVTQ